MSTALSGPCRAHLDSTTTRRGSAKRNAAFTLQHGAMLTTRQPEGCVPVVVSRCAPQPAGIGVKTFKQPGPLISVLRCDGVARREDKGVYADFIERVRFAEAGDLELGS